MADIEFPEKLMPLFEPHRYKITYGGRGGAKSWGIARALLIQGAQEPLRILCAREIQKSINESVHQLLRDQIEALGLSGHYEVLQNEIRGRNGTLFLFAGLKHNVANIKSKEGLDRVWIEEAQTTTRASWDTLIPTIRKDGSEIWISFNPELETDETYKRFVLNPPADSVVIKVGWQDNPWFPSVLKAEMEDLKARDHDSYLTVWEGHTRQALQGAIYADELRAATQAGRITRVPYDATKPVHTFWDLGWADNTSIWFAQAIGFEFRLIDYHSDSQKALTHYLAVLKNKGYVYGTDWMPHDAESRQMATGRSIEELMREAGRDVRIVPRLSLANGINAVRTLFGKCYFDEANCADGLQCLRHYRYDTVKDTSSDGSSLKGQPLHDWASHGADALRYFAVAMQEPVRPVVYRPRERRDIA